MIDLFLAFIIAILLAASHYLDGPPRLPHKPPPAEPRCEENQGVVKQDGIIYCTDKYGRNKRPLK